MNIQKKLVQVTTEVEAQVVNLCEGKLQLSFLPSGDVILGLANISDGSVPGAGHDERFGRGEITFDEFDIAENDLKILSQLFSQQVAKKVAPQKRTRRPKDDTPSAGPNADYVLAP